MNVASKKRQPVKVQLRNAVSVQAVALKRQSRNVQSTNEAPVADRIGEVGLHEHDAGVLGAGEVRALPVLLGDLV